jgi:hypothetical protein
LSFAAAISRIRLAVMVLAYSLPGGVDPDFGLYAFFR